MMGRREDGELATAHAFCFVDDYLAVGDTALATQVACEIFEQLLAENRDKSGASEVDSDRIFGWNEAAYRKVMQRCSCTTRAGTTASAARR